MSITISEVMTRDVTVIKPDDNVQQAAKMMADWNVGVLPVCEGKRLVGIVTDRDIAVRAIPAGKAPADIRAAEIMSGGVYWCFEDQTVGEALQHMGDAQIRRIPVVNRNMELVGIVSLGDLATRATRPAWKTRWRKSRRRPNRYDRDRTAASRNAMRRARADVERVFLNRSRACARASPAWCADSRCCAACAR
ncbi:MAG TPA: CBS domain-containing protein [Noviherbaspirillum sp.]|uniref:CBS domain-containing protein n=1 Tax=Noviherbaspirillum sp. TaxID=1926288 RepID=UPI002B48B3AA|nr:CBS domain-containing protein [Noviherbaspirillum sp.]HJV85145.1 CBS domain-containing protein [Noviherbaspirillum sp.]